MSELTYKGCFSCRPCKIHGQSYYDAMDCFGDPEHLLQLVECGCYTGHGSIAAETLEGARRERSKMVHEAALGYVGP